MEKEFFPPCTGTPVADRSPRMDRVPSEEMAGGVQGSHGGCGGGDQGHGNGGGGCIGYEGCAPDSWGLCEYPLAMVYAPCQMFRDLYDPATALSHGTLFSELNLPLGREGCGLTTLNCGCGRERRQS